MNNLRIALIAALIFVIAATPGLAVLTSSGPSLNASVLYYEPVPALPGRLLDVFVQIQNNDASARQVSVEFIDNVPFSIDNERDRVKSTDTIPARESFLVPYKVRVADSAVPGVNYIKVKYYSGDPQNAKIALLPIEVFASSVGLSIEDIKVRPTPLAPGREGEIAFTLRNLASLSVSEGFVRLDLSGVDIIPVGSTNQQRFVNLGRDEAQQFTFRVIPSPELAPGVYKIPLQTNYTDPRGNKYTITETIGLTVGAIPDLTTVVESSTLLDDGNAGEVIFRVTNKGLGEVKFVNLELQPGETYKVVGGSAVQYIGNIDSDDYKTARMQLKRTSGSGDAVDVPVKVTYTDALNNQYAQELVLKVPVGEKSGGGGSTWVVIIVLLAIVGGGYWYFRRR